MYRKPVRMLAFLLAILCCFVLASCGQKASIAVNPDLLALISKDESEIEASLAQSNAFEWGGREIPTKAVFNGVAAELELDNSISSRAYCEDMTALLVEQFGQPARYNLKSYDYANRDYKGIGYSSCENEDAVQSVKSLLEGSLMGQGQQLTYFFPLAENAGYVYCTFTSPSLEKATIECKYGIVSDKFPWETPGARNASIIGASKS